MITARRSTSSRWSARPALDRKLPLAQRVVVRRQRLRVLAVAGADLADRRHAEPDQVAVGLRAVTLEIAVQPALALGHGERIVRQCEVVHADVDVTQPLEAADRRAQHVHPVAGRGQLVRVDAALRLESLRQVRIGVQRDAVRPQRADLRDRAGERGRRLAGQTVDQVDIDRLEAERPGLLHQRAHRLVRLHPVDRLLHLGVEVLHAEAQPVEAQAPGVAAGPRRRCADRPRSTPRHRARCESPPQHAHQPRELGVAQKCGRAAAEVQLGDRLADARAPRGADRSRAPAQRRYSAARSCCRSRSCCRRSSSTPIRRTECAGRPTGAACAPALSRARCSSACRYCAGPNASLKRSAVGNEV